MPFVPDAAMVACRAFEDEGHPGARAQASAHLYDASDLELAQRETLPLATLDTDLARAARAQGVPILDSEAAS